jgi:hypothetical protein
MSFRLRRGTDTERQSVVFAEGELVYTTDTKELYVGDGTTLGGIRITGAVSTSPIALTQDLDMNSFNIIGSGDIEVNGQITANAFYGNGSGLTNLPLLDVNNGASYQINIMGADSSIMVNSDTSEFFGDFIGNLKGAVYDNNNNIMVDNVLRTMYGTLNGEFNGVSSGLFIGDDSSVIINGASNTLTGTLSTGLIDVNGQLDLVNLAAPENPLFVSLKTTDNQPSLKLQRTSNTDISASELGYGSISFSKDDTNGELTTSIITATRSFLFMANDTTGAYADDKWFSISNGKFGFGTFGGTERLTVAGNAVVQGFVQFGGLTSTQRDALTAVNGMVIYNTTNNRFEGRQNGVWINLDDGTTAS